MILAPDATVAEALARIRDPTCRCRWRPRCSSAVRRWRRRPGRYLGNVGFQRLLRETPSQAARAGASTRTSSRSSRRCSEREVAAQLAAYDVVSLAVVDEAGRLVGAVTIDDVLDRVLPDNWRLALSETPMTRDAAGATDGPRRRSREPQGHAGRPGL